MSNKLGKSSERYVSTSQSKEVVEKINAVMEQLSISPNAIRDLDDDPGPIQMTPTGVLTLDHRLKGGIPSRSVCELFGDSQGGKSWLAQKVMAYVTQHNQRALFADVEVGFNPFRAQEIGVILSNTSIYDNYMGGTEVLNAITKMISSGAKQATPPFIEAQPFDLYVIDSIAVLPSDQQLKGEGSMGDRSRMISKWQREILPALSRSVGTWRATKDENIKVGRTLVPISANGLGETLWKQIGDAVKKRKKAGANIDLFDPEAIEKVGVLPPEVEAFEEELGLKISDIAQGSISFQKFSYGPIVLVVNQTRMTDFGSYLGPKKTVTGGQASLYMATTRINVEPVGGKSGRILNDNSGEIDFYLSRAKIVKSRFTKQVVEGIEIQIPAGETMRDEWDEFLSILSSKELYWYGRGIHHVPKPSDEVEPFIKTRDNVEFMQAMVDGGLDWAVEEIGLPEDMIEKLRGHCIKKIDEYNNMDSVSGGEESDDGVDVEAGCEPGDE
jgi:hypothetical protein